jgi:hypothetical protein
MKNLRRVKFSKFIPRQTDENHNLKEGTGIFDPVKTVGYFHCWGVTHEESEQGFGNYSVALVEEEDGTISEVLPHRIQFVR